ncbi:hypothetical protein [Nocardia sp. NPDC127526]
MIKSIIAELVVALGVLFAGNAMANVDDPVHCAGLIMTPGKLLQCLDD